MSAPAHVARHAVGAGAPGGAVPRPLVAERVHRWLAAPVALLASALAVTCAVSVADVLPTVQVLSLTNERFVGWAGAGVAAGCGLTVVALVLARRTGAGPALSFGAAAGVLGLALGDQVVDDVQVTLALLALGIAVAGLLTGAATMALELPGKHRTATLLAWLVPLVCGWPVVTWFALHDAAVETARLTVHPPISVLAPATGLIVLWSALSLLVEPPRARAVGVGWETPWSALVGVFGAASVTVMLLGFEPGVDRAWLRPLVIAAVAAVVAGLVAVAAVVPLAAARIGYLSLLVASLCAPACVQLLLVVSDAGGIRVGWPLVGLLVVGGLVGVALGWRWPLAGSWLGLLALAGAAAGAWVMPDGAWPMFAAAGPFVAATGVAAAAGLRLCTASPMALRFAVLAVVGASLVGAVFSVALGWSLAGDLAATTDDARAVGRVLLGITFAVAVLAAGYIATVTPRLATETAGHDRTPA